MNNIEQQIFDLRADRDAISLRLEQVESVLKPAATPMWKRLIFRIDGWGPWWQNREEPRWRPWRRWWTS